MGTKTITLNERSGDIIAQLMRFPIKQVQKLFLNLAVRVDRDTMMTFKMQGAWQDRKKWVPYSPLTLHPAWKAKNSKYSTRKGDYVYNPSLWRRRPGTDNAKKRTYENAKLLQASGGFKQSFGIKEITNNKVVYGTRHELAEKIMRLDRRAIQLTRWDKNNYSQVVHDFMVAEFSK